jgi:hyaluronan synthase
VSDLVAARLFGFPEWVPVSLLGLFVWTTWLIRQGLGSLYGPAVNDHRETVSVIVPIWREDREVIERCLSSWKRNDPLEIILVIDHSEHDLIPIAQGWAAEDPTIKVIVVVPPGKRHALVRGIREASGDVVALTDSDTMWEDGFLEKVLMGFADPAVGGVGCRQNVYQTGTALWRRVADWMLDVRFIHYLPAMARKGAISCISGRTASYRRDVVLPMLDDLEFETFWGKPCVSGDDGRLTWLILRNGWKAAYQMNARAWTVFPDTFRGFLKQRVRWSRNSYRCYLRAMGRGWLWQQPVITSVSVLQNLLGPFLLCLAVFFLVRGIMNQDWLLVAVSAMWLVLGRAIKGIGHLFSEPSSVIYVPLVTIIFIVVMIPVKVYALITMNRQGWITRRSDMVVAEGQGGDTLLPGGPEV